MSMTELPDCDELHARLIGQLDTLIPFLALAHHDVFDVLSSHYASWSPPEQQDTLPNTYDAYATQVAHGAFLLGYSYAEAFITDLMWQIYSTRRDLLPEDKTLKYVDVLTKADFTKIVRHMIDCTISELNSLEKKILHLETRFNLNIPQPNLMKEAHIARNALVHNAGTVNRESIPSSRWHVGDRIILKVTDVHEFGIMARRYTREMCDIAKALCSKGQ